MEYFDKLTPGLRRIATWRMAPAPLSLQLSFLSLRYFLWLTPQQPAAFSPPPLRPSRLFRLAASRPSPFLFLPAPSSMSPTTPTLRSPEIAALISRLHTFADQPRPTADEYARGKQWGMAK